MILGIPFQLFLQFHVAISLVALATGAVAMAAAARHRHLSGWVAAFLATTAVTVATGFAFPTGAVTPAQIVGVLTTATLLLAAVALYGKGRAGAWRVAYAVGAVGSLYLNGFVAVVQAFQKLAPLATLAPTQTEAPFIAAQLALLALAVAAGVLMARRVRLLAAAG